MATTVEALVEPRLLAWARRSAGLSVEATAHKTQTSVERIAQWESGGRRPTLKQLRKLGRVYHRPLAVFYLPEPPTDFTALHDFRRLPGVIAGTTTPQLILEVRKAQARTELATELAETAGIPLPEFSYATSLSTDPEVVASEIRQYLGVSHVDQGSFTTDYDGLNYWRRRLEDAGVLVFQSYAIDVDELRGFSITNMSHPAVVVNVKDAVRGRLFTMAHELAHIALRRGGLCDLEEEAARGPEELAVERYCNHVAGGVLVPMQALLAEPEVQQQSDGEWLDETLEALAARYGASREVVLRRLLLADRTTKDFYQTKRQQFSEEAREYQANRRRGIVPPGRKALSASGPTFATLILQSYYQERITPSDVSDFLEVKLKHLPKIESALAQARQVEATA